jgi:hypothetical protein
VSADDALLCFIDKEEYSTTAAGQLIKRRSARGIEALIARAQSQGSQRWISHQALKALAELGDDRSINLLRF